MTSLLPHALFVSCGGKGRGGGEGCQLKQRTRGMVL